MMKKTAAFLVFVLLSAICGGAELLYCLQPQGRRSDFPERASGAERSHIVIDESFDGSPNTRWTPQELRCLRRKGAVVLCYLSIGEAEDYRGYWQKNWKKNPPRFLLSENPAWKGNYRVRYWDPAWQKLILEAVDRIAAAGFDGLYLDIVDGFEFFEGFGKKEFCRNKETGRTYREDMILWILRIAERGRRQNPKFRIFMQNGEALLENPQLRAEITGIALEDLFSNGAKVQKKAEIRARLGHIKPCLAAGKICFAVEYAPQNREKQLQQCVREYGIPVLLTGRELRQFGTFLPAAP